MDCDQTAFTYYVYSILKVSTLVTCGCLKEISEMSSLPLWDKDDEA
jgi:hypothetical protein